jgi:hypothetical protein
MALFWASTVSLPISSPTWWTSTSFIVLDKFHQVVGKKRVGEPEPGSMAGAEIAGMAAARGAPPLRACCTTAGGTLEGAGGGCDMTPWTRGRAAGRLSLNLKGVLTFLRKRSEGMVIVRSLRGTMDLMYEGFDPS